MTFRKLGLMMQLPLVLSAVVHGETLEVPQQFVTIQSAISAANSGDIIVVSPGVYPEHIDFLGKAITVRSVNPGNPATVQATIIDGSLEHDSIVSFSSSEGTGSMLNGLTLTNGAGSSGAAVRIDAADPAIINCRIANNIASGGTPPGYLDRYGAVLSTNGALPRIEKCTFINNGGGAGGALTALNASHPQIVDCSFTDNQARQGGGLLFNGAGGLLQRCLVLENNADAEGGGIFAANAPSDLTLESCVIASNNSQWGAGVFSETALTIRNSEIANNVAAIRGGAVSAFASVTLRGCTIVANQASIGRGLDLNGFSAVAAEHTLLNCIFWGHTPGGTASAPPIWLAAGADFLNIRDSNIEGGLGSIQGDFDYLNKVIWGATNIDMDPLFVDVQQSDYHLAAASPCIDAGDPFYSPSQSETDVDGQPRVSGGRIDMGADENPAQSDCNGNGIADANDLTNGTSSDCNTNEIPDECDILSGSSTDCNGDQIPDACQPDADEDGVIDICDECPNDFWKSQPLVCGCGQPDADSDGDGVLDCEDVCAGFDDAADSDGDGVADGCDFCPGDDGKKHPGVCGCGFTDADNDGDGFADCVDVCPGHHDAVDNDGDLVPNGCDNCPLVSNSGQDDADGDGVGDACTQDSGSGAIQGGLPEDGDGDSIADLTDNCPNTPNKNQLDSDKDGYGDACDVDDDGDGVFDWSDDCALTPFGTIVAEDGCPPVLVEVNAGGPDVIVKTTAKVMTTKPAIIIEYTISITNPGAFSAERVRITAPLDPGTQLLKISHGGSRIDDTLIWPEFDLRAGKSTKRKYSIVIDSDAISGNNVGETEIIGTDNSPQPPPSGSAADQPGSNGNNDNKQDSADPDFGSGTGICGLGASLALYCTLFGLCAARRRKRL